MSVHGKRLKYCFHIVDFHSPHIIHVGSLKSEHNVQLFKCRLLDMLLGGNRPLAAMLNELMVCVCHMCGLLQARIAIYSTDLQLASRLIRNPVKRMTLMM